MEPLDLAIGETLIELFSGDRLLRLGYARQVDYMRERLGQPPGTVYAWTRLAAGLAERPLLRRAVAASLVTSRKAHAILPVARGADELRWTAAATTATLPELEAAVRAAGAEPPERFLGESLSFKMNAEQQERLDAALALAEESLGFGASRWRCLEALCQEWTGEYGQWAPPDEPEAPPPPAEPLPPVVAEQLRAIEEALAVVEEPERTGCCGARELDARALRLLKARSRYDLALGPLLLRAFQCKIWRLLGCRDQEEYCEERLGMGVSTARQRAWLERRMLDLPQLREALAAERLTYSKAVLVAQDATPDDIEERIEAAASTTWQQTARETTKREDRQNREAGRRRLWGPREVMRLVASAIAGAQALWREATSEKLDDGAALAVIADHFVKVWKKSRPKMSRKRREIFMRHGGLCAVPGCSRQAKHGHHMDFRSHGGSDAVWNIIALCAAHHLQAVHRGRLDVTGKAGERVIWRFGTEEVFLTEDDDDVSVVREPAMAWPQSA